MRKDIIKGVTLGLKIWLMVLLVATAFAFPLSRYALEIEPNQLTIIRENMSIGLEKPVKIVFITDIHIETLSDGFLQSALDAANAEDPDYIFLGGDYAGIPGPEMEGLAALNELHAAKGIFAVLGNHEYLVGDSCPNEHGIENAENMSAFLESMGIRVLKDDTVETEDFTLIGLDEYWACRSDYEKIFRDMNGSQPTVVLTHDQESIPEERYESISLVLAGHTHCGQVRLPIIGSIPKLQGFKGKYEMGIHQFDNDSYLYASCGLGIKPRFLSPPDITIIDLS